MSRYIDADALIQELKRQYMFLFGTEEIPNGIGMLIENFPTADVVKVVHGAWLNTTHGLKCSNCELISPYNNRYFNFCPMCGADMRGGHNERE